MQRKNYSDTFLHVEKHRISTTCHSSHRHRRSNIFQNSGQSICISLGPARCQGVRNKRSRKEGTNPVWTAPFRKVVCPGFRVRQIQKCTLLPKTLSSSSKITIAGSSTCHDAYFLRQLLLEMSTRVIHHLVSRKCLAKTRRTFACWQLSDLHILFRLFLKTAWRFNSSFLHARSKFFQVGFERLCIALLLWHIK